MPLQSKQIRRPAALGTQSTGHVGADARTSSPGTLPTNAADVDADSVVSGPETEDDASRNELVGSSTMDDAVLENGMPSLHQESYGEDGYGRMV